MKIRKALIRDVMPMQQIVNSFAGQHLMLSRSLNDLYENLRDYWVAEKAGDLLGCCSIHVAWDALAEIKALAVLEKHQNKGIGRQLVKSCLEEARQLGISRVFTLTYLPDFFERMGFLRIEKEALPHKIWSECVKCHKFPDCDEIALEFRVE